MPGCDWPLVSVCIPAYQGAEWIAGAIDSVVQQDYENLEILISDDGSRDGTVATARRFGDPRIRVLASKHLGMARNWNRCLQASRGDYIKFLMQDDRLRPGCVSRMVALMLKHPSMGIAFSPRLLDVENASDPAAMQWLRRYDAIHERLGDLLDVNQGRALFDAFRSRGFRDNWIGEPTVVMVRRHALQRVGLFNVRLQQVTDLELWLRLAFFYDVGFIPEPLATFRVHARSASFTNLREGLDGRIERLWLLAGLRAHPEIRAALGWDTEVLAWSLVLGSAARTGKLLIDGRIRAFLANACQLRDYLWFQIAGRSVDLHEPLAAK
jgi:glycosyltransferase involved in cell wall biosynthesis